MKYQKTVIAAAVKIKLKNLQQIQNGQNKFNWLFGVMKFVQLMWLQISKVYNIFTVAQWMCLEV